MINLTKTYIAIISVSLLINYSNHVNRLHTPRSRVVVAADIPTPTPTPQKEWRSDKLLHYIHFKESNYGTHPSGLHTTCRSKGQINEWGYLPSKGFCFRSREEAEITIKQKLSKLINKGWSDQKILCYYNIGKVMTSCPYSEDYK